MEKDCTVCKTTFTKKANESKKAWEKRKFCSHECYSKSLPFNREWRQKNSIAHLGKPGFWAGKKRPAFSEQWKKNMARVPWNKGKELPELSEEKASAWKGDKVGYHALHLWVSKHLGRPKRCEHCKRIDLKRYEWANISKEYKRDISDWIRLCKSCHMFFDNTGYKIWDSRRASK